MDPHAINGVGTDAFYANIRAIIRDEIDKPLSTLRAASSAEQDNELTIHQACSLLQVCVTTLRRLRRNGQLPFRKIGGRVYLSKADVLALRGGKEVSREA